MSCKRKLNFAASARKMKRNFIESRNQEEEFAQPECNDTEAAMLFIKKMLTEKAKKDPFPPVVFIHQIYDIIKNKTTVNRQVEMLRNKKKIILIHIGNEENQKVVILMEDLKSHVLQNCSLRETLMYNKFFDKVLQNTTDIGISRLDLLVKFNFSEKDVRTLVNAGLLILRETGIFWFSFPSAGIFMKKLIKGRRAIVNQIKKRKFHEILQNELEKMPIKKQVELPLRYHIHDLIGGNFLKRLLLVVCFEVSTSQFRRYPSSLKKRKKLIILQIFCKSEFFN